MFAKWSYRLALGLMSTLVFALAGCGDISGSSDSNGSKADTFTVTIDGGTPTVYTEAEANNDFGYDPYIVAWRDTVYDQTHAFVATGIGSNSADLIVSVTWEPEDATGTPGTLQEVRYEYNFAFNSDPANIDDANGTIDVTKNSANEGGAIKGTFDGFTNFNPGDGKIDTLAGEFDVTREADDLF